MAENPNQHLVGKESPPATIRVDRARIRQFARAVGLEDPVYYDEEAARKAGYPRIPVSPTFLQALTNDDPEKGGLLKLINVDIGLILHGEQHYDYFAPVFVGDKVTCQQKIVDIYDKKGGALWFIVSETAMKNEAGKMVAKATGITVVRNPDAGKK